MPPWSQMFLLSAMLWQKKTRREQGSNVLETLGPGGVVWFERFSSKTPNSIWLLGKRSVMFPCSSQSLQREGKRSWDKQETSSPALQHDLTQSLCVSVCAVVFSWELEDEATPQSQMGLNPTFGLCVQRWSAEPQENYSNTQDHIWKWDWSGKERVRGEKIEKEKPRSKTGSNGSKIECTAVCPRTNRIRQKWRAGPEDEN